MSVYTANCIYPLVNDLLLIPTCYLLLLLSLWWIYSKLIGFRASFRSKNRFTLLTFFAYTVVVGTFSAIYQGLITLDAQREPWEVPHFIISQETSLIKLNENRADLKVQIRLDTAELQLARQSLASLERPGLLNLLEKLSDHFDGHYYLKTNISGWMRNQGRDLGQNYKASWLSDGVVLSDRHVLSLGLIWSNQLMFDQDGDVTSSFYIGNRSDSVLLSKRHISRNDYRATRFIEHQNPLYLSQHARNWYLGYIRSQFTDVTNPADRQDLFVAGYEAHRQISTIGKRLVAHQRLLTQSRIPVWSYWDTLFFTVVSLFANNYSDISPGDTTARLFIMAEFVLVWFITICAVALEPEGIARWWQRLVAGHLKRLGR